METKCIECGEGMMKKRPNSRFCSCLCQNRYSQREGRRRKREKDDIINKLRLDGL